MAAVAAGADVNPDKVMGDWESWLGSEPEYLSVDPETADVMKALGVGIYGRSG